MKILFIYPSSGNIKIAVNKYVTLDAYTPPLGLLYLAKMLEQNDHSVEVIDCNCESINKQNLKLKIKSFDVVGLTIYSKPEELIFSKQISKIIRDYYPQIPMIIGGPHSSIFPEESIIDHNADICVCGEGEFRINDIIDAIQGKKNLSSIPGIYYKDGKKIKHTKPAEQINDLDKIPFPSRHLVEKYDYGYLIKTKLIKGKVTSLITTRGCPHICKYCQTHIHFPHFRTRSYENISKELEEIANQGYNSVVFSDDNFLAQKKNVEKLMDFIIRKEFGMKYWIINARVDSADKNLYEKLRDAGVEAISFGIESGNQKTLDFFNKTITSEQARYAVDLSNDMGFFVSASFIIGAPFETKDDIDKTFKFARSLNLDNAFFHILKYQYGTPIWNQAVEDGKIKEDEFWVYSDVKRGLSKFTSEELQDFADRASRKFYFNFRYLYRLFCKSMKLKDFRYIKAGFKVNFLK